MLFWIFLADIKIIWVENKKGIYKLHQIIIQGVPKMESGHIFWAQNPPGMLMPPKLGNIWGL